MSIKSTMTITREAAISRINEVRRLITNKDYKGLEEITFEQDHCIVTFINNAASISPIDKWTDKMLDDKMDEPFYRQSMFDNYHIR